MSSKWKIGKKVFEFIAPKPSVGKSALHKDMAESKIKMMKDMGKTQKKVGIDKYKEKGGHKIYKKILKIDPGNP
tara:strand:- start:307 stop:528 length:222 start_codon:yes stop_codon:yes gene_type:complete